MARSVKSVWAGGLTHTGVTVLATTAPATAGSLRVAENEAMTGAATYGPVAPDAQGHLRFRITGLTAATRYWYVVDDGEPNTSYKGTFRTHPGPPGEPLSYIFGAAGDAGLTGEGDEATVTRAVSNGFVFPTMVRQSLAEQWCWFSHLGDLHYRNIRTNSPALYRAAYDDNLNYNKGVNPAARQGRFLRTQAVTYVWDDHDFGPNNSDRTNPGRPAAQKVYREYVPSYPLPDRAGIHHSWQVGRVLYVAADVRSFRDPNTAPAQPSKTMIGPKQKAWLEALLTGAGAAGAEVLVWQSPSRWVGGTDTWDSFRHEREEMIQLFGDTGWLDRMLFLTADMHALSICSGPHNPYGRFPMFMFASMDSGSWDTGSEYDIGSVAGRRQYGTVRVEDAGDTITLTGTGYHDGTARMSHAVQVHVG
ncbi:alkaline phosphatase D family protein [Streptomyces sp. NPDC059009]|uniref:alkaline phosphatase D family protein n=1 Tax=Streptomyces sp. NPDC059009 TaxID=3346694 RepID=UPI00369E7822